MAERVRPPRFRWVAAWLAITVVPRSLETLGRGSAVVGVAVSLLIGLGAGAFWYWAYPRPLAQRLTWAALWAAVFTIVTLVTALLTLGDATGSRDAQIALPRIYVAVGILCALVLAERAGEWRGGVRDEPTRRETAARPAEYAGPPLSTTYGRFPRVLHRGE